MFDEEQPAVPRAGMDLGGIILRRRPPRRPRPRGDGPLLLLPRSASRAGIVITGGVTTTFKIPKISRSASAVCARSGSPPAGGWGPRRLTLPGSAERGGAPAGGSDPGRVHASVAQLNSGTAKVRPWL